MDADWTAIELDWRAGVLPASAVAKKHGLGLSQLKSHAQKYGWERKPLDPFAVQRAHGVASTAPSRPKFSMDSDLSSPDVERAAVLQAAAVLDIHRTDVKKLREQATEFSAALGALFASLRNATSLEGVVEMESAIKLMGVLNGDKSPADLLEQLSRVMVRLVQIERQAYGLDALPVNSESGAATEQVQSQVNKLWAEIQAVQKEKTAIH